MSRWLDFRATPEKYDNYLECQAFLFLYETVSGTGSNYQQLDIA